MRSLLYTLLIMFGCASFTLQADPVKRKKPFIALIGPSSPSNTYWPAVFRVIDSVARDLDFEFQHFDTGVTDRFILHEMAIKLLKSDRKPDALIIAVSMGNAKPVLEVAEQEKVAVIILGPLFPQELKAVGYTPRSHYKTWIANLDQNEVHKGYLSAKLLFTRAMAKKYAAKDGKIHLLALGGQRWWVGSLQREEGLQKALREFPQIVLKQTVPVDWEIASAEEMTLKLLKRFPEASLVWAASDAMAEGAVRAFEQSGRNGKDGRFLVSGIDLSVLGLNNVLSGRTVGTAAMSVLGMGEMVIYLYDYLKGHDFLSEIGVNISPETLLATPDNAAQYLSLFNHVDRIDYRRFSKVYNSDLKKYDFSINTLLEAAQLQKL